MGLLRESDNTDRQMRMLPERIGDYSILDSLGSGTFGDVYKVEKDGNVFALKHIVLGSKVDTVVLQLEVDSHGSLPKHDNIVDFIDYFRSWYRWNIVLEFCELGTLESYILKYKPNETVAKSFMLDMARGLNHLHSNNIVHRDIKPENILLVPGKCNIPVCKISDFGVARFISIANEGTMTNEETDGEKYFKTLRGSPYYVAPEVRKGHYTKSCDIFSTGIVFYLIFSKDVSSDKRLVPWIRGGTPFYRATDSQVQDQLNLHVKDDKFNQLIRSMMLIDFHQRISASSLLEELEGNLISEDGLIMSACPRAELQGLDTDLIDNKLLNGTSTIVEYHNDTNRSHVKNGLKRPVKTVDKMVNTESVLVDVKKPQTEDKMVNTEFQVEIKSLNAESKRPPVARARTKFTSPRTEAKVGPVALPRTERGRDTTEDEVFIAVCVLVAVICMLVWLPLSLFLVCMALLWVAGMEFLPDHVRHRLRVFK